MGQQCFGYNVLLRFSCFLRDKWQQVFKSLLALDVELRYVEVGTYNGFGVGTLKAKEYHVYYLDIELGYVRH